ncbi:MAG: peptide chain release factor N(5)-glutamine methyltransferase [Clostridia bacterium]
MTIKQAIERGVAKLKLEKITTPKLKVRLLMQYVLEKPRQYLIIYDNEPLTRQQEDKFFDGISKLSKDIPIEHITHKKEFMKLDFFVDENVLIPRQDTEILVEEVIEIAKKINAKKILDLCTGSGAIAISLAKYLPNTQMTALDISSKALEVAKLNAKTNNVESQITFVESNLLENLPKEKYDMIVSNPPYIKQDIIKELDREVQKEPHIALDGGKDGLDFYRKIIDSGYEYLKYGGYLCLEIGYDQKEEVMNLLDNNGQYINKICIKDLYDNDRVIIAKVGD